MKTLQFLGGAKSVTGSNYLLDLDGTRILIDCGLFQGSQYAEPLNYEKFPYDTTQIDAVVLTHAHTDHAGRLPKLFKEGFRGKVIATEATLELLKYALYDNMGLIADEAMRDQHPPLFDEKDMDGAFSLSEPLFYNQEIHVGKGVKIILHDAGHILGSSIVEIQYQGQKYYFTGDLGNPPMPLLNPPDFVHDANFVVIESAYGDRVHEDIGTRRKILSDAIKETVKDGGTLMIPSFAMERTQEIIYELNEMDRSGELKCSVPIFIDSPLAVKLTSVYKRFPDYFNDHTQKITKIDDIFNFPCLRYVISADDSKKISTILGPKVVIAGSGMSTGGRILHHQMKYLPDPKSTILFVGYQVQGSLGRKIVDGAKDVTIFGNRIPVRCKIKSIGGYSAHADQNQLLKWLKESSRGGKLEKIFVVQGEEKASSTLAYLAKNSLGIESIVPSVGDIYDLEGLKMSTNSENKLNI